MPPVSFLRYPHENEAVVNNQLFQKIRWTEHQMKLLGSEKLRIQSCSGQDLRVETHSVWNIKYSVPDSIACEIEPTSPPPNPKMKFSSREESYLIRILFTADGTNGNSMVRVRKVSVGRVSSICRSKYDNGLDVQRNSQPEQSKIKRTSPVWKENTHKRVVFCFLIPDFSVTALQMTWVHHYSHITESSRYN